jgi:hypothetical protein
MRTVPARILTSLALIAVAGALTGCGVRNSVDPVAAAATKSQGSGGYKATMSVSIASGAAQVTMTARGTFDKDEGELSIDLPGSAGTMHVINVVEDGDPVVYMSLGFLTGQLSGGKSWVRLDLEKAGKAAGIDFSQLMSAAAGQNPTQALELLRANGDFSVVGQESVDGVDTTHYHGSVDLAKAAAASGATADIVKRLIDLGAPSQVPVDVWVDDAGFVRQYKTSYDQTFGGQAVSMGMTMNMSDYGTPVEISAPPADDVFDATELASSGLQRFSGTTSG